MRLAARDAPARVRRTKRFVVISTVKDRDALNTNLEITLTNARYLFHLVLPPIPSGQKQLLLLRRIYQQNTSEDLKSSL